MRFLKVWEGRRSRRIALEDDVERDETGLKTSSDALVT